MNLHEYQAKQLFSRFGIPVPKGQVVSTVAEAEQFAQHSHLSHWVVKAQIHAGGRGQAGGVKKVNSSAELAAAVNTLLGSRLVTHQSDSRGQIVNQLLIEPVSPIARELYLSMVVDRSCQKIVFIVSAAGGMAIEQVATETPEQLLTIAIDPLTGLQPYQTRQAAFFLTLEGTQIRELGQLMSGLYRLFTECDASLVEINPLIVTDSGQLLALDAKINLDDNALYRQKELASWRDASQEDEREYSAAQHGLNYVSLDGTIGCMVNGAGLAMATMDLIKLHGATPANFLDVGGTTTAERVAAAFKLILSDSQVKAILVNIFGGIVRCDLIAEGIIQAFKEVKPKVPLVVRLEGTNMAQGRELLAQSGLNITAENDLEQAAAAVVAAAQGA
ncbi:ADP-forming succinate--CoA ligase subunit beta [Ectothiorhodospiraceae bacterium BW-2]|nr:ADP-forming succinate--CoA ligase subunit beta [Ectothiorhodospiraceae bacterium BW-2]